jgi:hypothetical protein
MARRRFLRCVAGLPVDGSTIYVTLYSYVAGQWLSNGYIYVSGP